MDEIDNERKLEAIDRDIEQWKELFYQAEIRHQVHKKLKSTRGELKMFQDEMVRSTKAINILKAMRAEVEAEIAREAEEEAQTEEGPALEQEVEGDRTYPDTILPRIVD
jgi:septal ring factor EnvC (AmiA/AmiB activator)